MRLIQLYYLHAAFVDVTLGRVSCNEVFEANFSTRRSRFKNKEFLLGGVNEKHTSLLCTIIDHSALEYIRWSNAA